MVRQISGKKIIHLGRAFKEIRKGDAGVYQDLAHGVLERQSSPAKSGLLLVH